MGAAVAGLQTAAELQSEKANRQHAEERARAEAAREKVHAAWQVWRVATMTKLPFC